VENVGLLGGSFFRMLTEYLVMWYGAAKFISCLLTG